MDKDEKEIKGRLVLNRLMAMLALPAALVCVHHAYLYGQLTDVRGWLWGAAAGLLCAVTVKCTIKASIYASGLLMAEVYEQANKSMREHNR